MRMPTKRRVPQHELPHESLVASKSATPGPGAYEITATRYGSEKSDGAGITSAFAPGKIAVEIEMIPSIRSVDPQIGEGLGPGGGNQADRTRSDQGLAKGIKGLGQYKPMLPKGIFQQSHIVPYIGKHLRGIPVEQNQGGGRGVRSVCHQSDIPARFGHLLGGVGIG